MNIGVCGDKAGAKQEAGLVRASEFNLGLWILGVANISKNFKLFSVTFLLSSNHQQRP